MIPFDPELLHRWASDAAPACQWWSLRARSETTENLTVRDDIAQAPSRSVDAGLMVTIAIDGGVGHAATGDASARGIAQAFADAIALARASAGRMVFDFAAIEMPAARGRYASPVQRPMPGSLADRVDLVAKACRRLKIDDRICDWRADLSITDAVQFTIGPDGLLAEQRWHWVVPNLSATARSGGQTQTRTSAGQYNGYCAQGGLELLERSGFLTDGERIAAEAIELTQAPDCPTGTMDLLLMPDQMLLQIHESIGHPLELDRILGDERNFAGTSFVTLDMFGSYRYGSDLLNVCHDPTADGHYASFGFDDDGTPAERRMLIERGILMQPLGGTVSHARLAHPTGAPGQQAVAHGLAALSPVATTRASSWNRAPIDRMSNLDIEPGDSTLEQMIAAVEHGVLMRTNTSWSIDDSRNKFQFGCEYGRMIRAGRLAEVVRNPNYRGTSSAFWRSLAMVGDRSTFQAMGTPYCGKGEPMQVVRVGHASPACLFRDIEVFGGA